MKVKWIGVFDDKFEDSDDTEINTDYYLKNVIEKEDFDNGEIEGISYCDKKFFYMREDLNFMINGEHYELSLNEDIRTNNPRKEELEKVVYINSDADREIEEFFKNINLG